MVAIVIVVILATIVFINVFSYINKGKDASIKGNLSSLFSRGVRYFDEKNNYNGFCLSNSGGAPIKTAIEEPKVGGDFRCNCNVGGGNCTGTPTKWCACSPLKVVSGSTFCVDSSSYRKESNNSCEIRCMAGNCSD